MAESQDKAKSTEPRDVVREILETVVFVVMLVLMLQLFVAQAFVIPTGSMATTLLGNHRSIECDQCGYHFTVNASEEMDLPDENRVPARMYICPNCRYRHQDKLPSPDGGDRVIVLKPAFDLLGPSRFDIPVFKYPGSSGLEIDRVRGAYLAEHPNDEARDWLMDHPNTPPDGPLALTWNRTDKTWDWERRNYIKRLIGLGGETIAVSGGNIYISKGVISYDDQPNQPATPEEAWRWDFMYPSQHGLDYLNENGFEILRKPPHVIMEMRRIVHDNQHHARRLVGEIAPRWWPEAGSWEANDPDMAGWELNDSNAPTVFTTNASDVTWLRYRHLVPDVSFPGSWSRNDPRDFGDRPKVITDFLGYNLGSTGHWVRDLMVECDVDARSAGAEVILEVSEGVDRFQAVFLSGEGKCVLRRVRRDDTTEDLAEAECRFNKPGRYSIRLANFDNRLTVWVDGRVLNFGDGADYQPSPRPETYEEGDTSREGWVRQNDIERPARIGVQGDVTVSQIRLWHDTFYTNEGGAKVNTYYVQPGHYFCMGDNSAASADSRNWGLVPERLLIGRALLVYYPLSRIGLIK